MSGVTDIVLAINKFLCNLLFLRLPEVIPEIKNHMYPVHGSYFLQHDGNIYKLEKVDNIHNGLDDSEQLRDLSRLTEQTSQKFTDQAQTRYNS